MQSHTPYVHQYARFVTNIDLLNLSRHICFENEANRDSPLIAKNRTADSPGQAGRARFKMKKRCTQAGGFKYDILCGPLLFEGDTWVLGCLISVIGNTP